MDYAATNDLYSERGEGGGSDDAESGADLTTARKKLALLPATAAEEELDLRSEDGLCSSGCASPGGI